MYLKHFGLREFPFSITPDTGFFYDSVPAQEALNTILTALSMGEGFIKITGEVGTGKSMLCRKVINSLDKSYKVALILNPYRDPQSLFLELCHEFGAVYPPKQIDNQYIVMQALASKIISLSKKGNRVLICLDEAQAMPIETLETLRLLTNMESEKRKLVQIIIFGQPELDDKLSHPSIRQLKQRITFSYKLNSLAKSHLAGYLRHRLMCAGHKDGEIFSARSIRYLYKESKAVPRVINIMANKALLSAYGRGKIKVEAFDIVAASEDMVDSPAPSKSNFPMLLFLVLIFSLAFLLVINHQTVLLNLREIEFYWSYL
jgi:MSHA biogenesis protein MshM